MFANFWGLPYNPGWFWQLMGFTQRRLDDG